MMAEQELERSGEATASGIDLATVYSPSGPSSVDERIGDPGEYPFTRGIYSTMYRGRLWTMRQYAGFGSAESTNQRYRFLLDQGQTGLSVAFDLPSQIGYDSDDEIAEGEVGRVGVPIDTLADMEVVFDRIPLDGISTSFTINGTAAIMLAMYLVVAEKQGVPFERVTGTIQNDILKEYVARGTWIFPPKPSIRLIVDTLEYCAEHVPRFNAISIAGAHFRDAGANAIQELAYTLSNGITYVEACRDRGLDIERIGRRLSFFFYTHMDLFEEVAKYRAGRRLWARIMKERFGVSDKAAAFRVGVVCGGSSLTAEQPQNNIVRVAYEALASVLGGVQSVFTAAWDEALTLPSEASAELALRTQQVLAFESGVANVVDPLGGSWFVEELTDRYERECEAIIDEVESWGGMVSAIEEGRIQRAITDEAHRAQLKIDNCERPVVGVNIFAREQGDPGEVEIYEPPAEEIEGQVRRLAKVRRIRDADSVDESLASLRKAAAGDDNLMPHLLDCVRVYCTVGEITTVLRDVFGEFREPTGF